MFDRRTILSAAIGVLASAGVAVADTYPSKPVTFIVPWPAGGSSDLTMRALSDAASKHLGQPIVVENRAGASGTAGPAVMAASAKPDGYTIAQMPITVFRLPHMVKTAFDPTKDFTYILNVTGYTFGVVVKADAKWKTFGELVADAKANPGKISYGTPGRAPRSTSPWNRSPPWPAPSSSMSRSRAGPRRTPPSSAGMSPRSLIRPAGAASSTPRNCASS